MSDKLTIPYKKVIGYNADVLESVLGGSVEFEDDDALCSTLARILTDMLGGVRSVETKWSNGLHWVRELAEEMFRAGHAAGSREQVVADRRVFELVSSPDRMIFFSKKSW